MTGLIATVRCIEGHGRAFEWGGNVLPISGVVSAEHMASGFLFL